VNLTHPHSPFPGPMLPSARMRCRVRLLIVCLVLAFSNFAWAQSTGSQGLERNIQLLRTSDDFRVRTQAALALGASADDRAVAPLCSALADTNRTVRIASATAISRLHLGGVDCISRQLQVEKDEAVHSALRRALERLGGAAAEPTIGPNTRIFIALEKVSGPARLDDPVRSAFVKGAVGRGDVAFAPRGMSTDEATALLKKYPQAKAFLLSPKLSRPAYEGGNLQIKISVAILTYPGHALMGSFSKSAGMGGISDPDQESENELVVAVAEESMSQFLTLAPTLDP
jgi:hypothetical protein